MSADTLESKRLARDIVNYVNTAWKEVAENELYTGIYVRSLCQTDT